MAMSDECIDGRHEQCDGCCLDSMLGCGCQCHDNEDGDDLSDDCEESDDAKP